MQNNLKIFLGILVVLVVVLLAEHYLPRLTSRPSDYFMATLTIKPDSLPTVTVGPVKLLKQNNQWTVGNRKADQIKIDKLLQNLLPVNSPQLVSASADRLSEFGVADSQATSVKLANLAFLLGKPASLGGIYVRMADSNQVYILSGLNAYDVATSSSFWADRTVFTVDSAKMQSVNINSGDKTYRFEFSGGKWLHLPDNKSLTDSQSSNLITYTSYISATSFPEDNPGTKYPANSALSLTVNYSGGNETLVFYQGKDDALVKRSDGQEFVVSSSTLANLTTLLKDF